MESIKSKEIYQAHWTKAADNLEEYWSEIAQNFDWKQKWTTVQSGDFNNLEIKWFDGAKVNITHNCIDRHLATRGNKTAVIWEGNESNEPNITYTYNELHSEVCRFANVLKDHGIKKGDRVVFYMSMVPELLTGLLACARIGAIHSVVFGGFSAQALAGRINDCKAKMVITNDEAYRGPKIVKLKEITDEALKDCSTVESVLVRKRTNNTNVNYVDGRDHSLLELIKAASPECEPEWMNAEDPLFIIYTSG